MAGTIEKSLLAVALLGIVLPPAGLAHGPSRQKITETIQIDAPPAKVWATIANFHDMSWLSGVAKTSGAGGNEPDVAKRQLTLDGGATTANVESNDVSVVDLAAKTLLGTVAVGKRPYAVALAKGRGFSADQYGGTVSVFDLATLQPVKRISVGDCPEGIRNQRRRHQYLRRQLVLERSLGDRCRDARGDRENAGRRRPPRVRNFFARNAMSFPKVLLALKEYQRGEKRGGHQGWYLSRAESIRPRLVITIQPPPRRSIDFTVPAPGMSSPGATSIEPRGLSTTATPA
jgi:YVTN family beta-propeller protein